MKIQSLSAVTKPQDATGTVWIIKNNRCGDPNKTIMQPVPRFPEKC